MDIEGQRLKSLKMAVTNLFSDMSGRIKMLNAAYLACVSQAGRARGGEHAAEEAMFRVRKQAVTRVKLIEWQDRPAGSLWMDCNFK